MIFNRRYKTLGVEKGAEREVERVDYERNTVWLGDGSDNLVDWRPYMLAGAKGGVEVHRSEEMELRKGDRVRWTRNDPGSELANGETAAVESVGKDGVRFRLEDGSAAKLAEGDPQLRHLDRAWASTVHAFQGRTVDGIVAAMPTGNPELTNQQSFYVAISRARDVAELVTDDAWKLSDQLERATGERVAALDGAAMQAAHETVFGLEADLERDGDQTAPGHETMNRGLEEEHITGPEHERELGLDPRSRRRPRPLKRAGARIRTGRGSRTGANAPRFRSRDVETPPPSGRSRDHRRQQSYRETSSEKPVPPPDWDRGIPAAPSRCRASRPFALVPVRSPSSVCLV